MFKLLLYNKLSSVVLLNKMKGVNALKGISYYKEWKREGDRKRERRKRDRDGKRAKAVFALKSRLKVTQGQTELKALGFISYLFSLYLFKTFLKRHIYLSSVIIIFFSILYILYHIKNCIYYVNFCFHWMVLRENFSLNVSL